MEGNSVRMQDGPGRVKEERIPPTPLSYLNFLLGADYPTTPILSPLPGISCPHLLREGKYDQVGDMAQS